MPSSITVVTCNAPLSDAAMQTATHGVHQRLGALLQAAQFVADRIYLIAAYRIDTDSASATPEALEQYYRRLCGVTVSVVKLILPPYRSGPFGRWDRVRLGLNDPLNFGPDDRFAADPDVEPARRLLRNSSTVLAHRLSGFCTLVQLGRTESPIVFDLDDIEHKTALRMLRFPPHYPGKLIELARPLGLLRLERRACSGSLVTFVCSEADKEWVRRFLNARRADILHNSSDVRVSTSPVPHSRNVLFVGTLNYLPNIEAARLLVENIWPKVLERCPDATLTIAGRCPERVPGSANPHPSVRFLGYVPSLDALYEQAQLVVCPINVGGGTRIKIIEAAMYGRPVVSTPIGAEGLRFEDPTEIRIRKGAEAFAAECARLLEQPAECQKISSASQRRAVELYSRDSFIRQVSGVMKRAAAPGENLVPVAIPAVQDH